MYLTTKILIHDRPKTGLEGKFSLPYCMARAMLDRSVRLKDFSDAAVNEPASQALLRKVTMRMEPRERQVACRSTASCHHHCEDEKRQVGSQRTDNPSGNAGNVEMEEIIAKFRECSQTLGDERTIKQVEEMVLGLEKLADIRTLMKALSGAPYKTLGARY